MYTDMACGSRPRVPRLLRGLWLYRVCRWVTNGLVLGSGRDISSGPSPDGGEGGSSKRSGSGPGTEMSRTDSSACSACRSSSAVVNRSPRTEIARRRISAKPGAKIVEAAVRDPGIGRRDPGQRGVGVPRVLTAG